MLNINFNKFKRLHISKKHQLLYISQKTDGEKEINNLINNFLLEKNSFIFESVEKGKIKGRYTIFGSKPDKVWEFNNNSSFVYDGKIKKKLNGAPLKNIESIIEKFNFKTPKEVPNISSIIAGYFSYDIIRYIETIPNNCKNDLGIPDVRLIRPTNLIVYDNLKKKNILYL